MKKQNWIFRSQALLLASAMIVQSVPGTLLPVAAQETETAAEDSQNQMASPAQTVPVNTYDASERSADFNLGWKFTLGDAGNAGAAAFDDSGWDDLNLPHDYSIDQDYNTNYEGESGFLPGGIAWYRKYFTLDESAKGKRVRIDFDGVYMNSTVYINGHELGSHPYGYTPFSYDLTDYLNFDGDNVIAVRVNHQIPSSRWYSGSGIYRDVKLTLTEDVHVALFGTAISSPDLEAEQGGEVTTHIQTEVTNDSDADRTVTVSHVIYPRGGEESAAIGSGSSTVTVPAGTTAAASADIAAENPALWSVASPNLYIVKTTVSEGDTVLDTVEDEYGYRYFAFDPDTGFSLNGEKMKLNGVCLHHDQGSLGSEAHYRATERQVQIMKEMGANAIRTSHNTASRAMIEACQRNGMLLIEEFFDGWSEKNGNTQDYTHYMHNALDADDEIVGGEGMSVWAEMDLKTTIRRDINSPSIIMWSLGNELEHGKTTDFPGFCQNLIDWVKELDPSRPVTLGDNKMQGDSSIGRTLRNLLASQGAVLGSNYANVDRIKSYYKDPNPTWTFYGSENVSAVNSRGVYDRIHNGRESDKDGKITSYDYSCVSWGNVASDSMYQMWRSDFMAGQFVWTGFDYIGEPTPWNGISSGPTMSGGVSPKNSYFGIVDTAGFAKDTYYFYASQWKKDATTLHVLPAWNEDVIYKDGSGKTPVVVYSSAPAVELFFTPAGSSEKQSLGKKEFTKITTAAGYTYQMYQGADKSGTAHRNLYLTWNVPYADGTITAVAYDEAGNEIKDTYGRSYVTTTGEEAKLKASADRSVLNADGSDLAYITVDVTDSAGNIVPDAANRVTFTVEGEGELLAVDNGLQTDYQSYTDDNRQAFSGKVLAIVRTTRKAGPITVTCEADGLENATVTLQSQPVEGLQEENLKSFTLSRTYYVKTGTRPDLPAEITANYADGTSASVPVVWDLISDEQIQTPGSFSVQGKAEGKTVSVSVHVIDEIGALMNYSATTPVGIAPVLPASRPAVLPDGTILTASFEVNWNEVDPALWNTPGTVVVEGTAHVMGTEHTVSATVRVQEETGVIKDSITHEAREITQNIPEAYQSDSLAAIKDGSTTLGKGGGTNMTVWTNYNWAKEGHDDGQITVAFDTQKLLGEIIIHFGDDAWCMSYPDANTTVIEVSNDGEDWTVLDTEESIGAADANGTVKPYTYSFAPIRATFVRVNVQNSSKVPSEGFSCTGITELEIKPMVTDLVTGKAAALESLSVNGTEVNETVLATGVYSTPARRARVEAVGKDNASVTVLPVQDDVVRILLESEDHENTGVFLIRLNQPYQMPADDASLDLPLTGMSASTNSEYPGSGNEGPVRYVLDGNPATYWHTNWQNNNSVSLDYRYVDINLSEPAAMNALRYLPRNSSGSGGNNGMVTEYKIQYKEGDDDEWKDIATGTWERSAGWKLAPFNKTVTAKHIRLYGVHAYADSGDDAHMSAAEIRLRKPEELTDLSALENLEITLPASVKTDVVDADHPVTITDQIVVTADGQTLENGIDFDVEYENNTDYGTATIRLVGLYPYTGSVERTFVIEKATEEPDPEPVKANKSLLQTAISYAEAQKNADSYAAVNSLVKAHFEAALEEAKAVMADEEATQEEVDNAWAALAHAVHYLGFTSNKSALALLTEECRGIAENIADYEGDTEEFLAALSYAEEVLASDTALDEQSIKAAYDRLSAAKDGLSLKQPPAEIDYSVLEALVSHCQGVETDLDKYVETGKPEFVSALRAGEALLDNAQTQEEVDAAVKTLNTALLNLRLKADEELVKALQNFVDLYESRKEQYENGNPRGYTEEEWSAVTETYNTVKAALEKAKNNELSQDEAASIKEAADTASDILNRTDKSALRKLHQELAELQEENYESGWDEFKTAHEYAALILAKEDATQDEIDEAHASLKAAHEALVEKTAPAVDKSALQGAVDNHSSLKEEDYTEDSWKEFADAMKHAKDVLADPDATQDEVDNAKNDLNLKAAHLVKKETPPAVTVDKSALEKAVKDNQDRKEADYTPETWKPFAEALDAAKAVLADENATQEQVEKAASDLLTAADTLKNAEKPPVIVVTDKEDLKDALEEAGKLKQSDYTAETWKKLQDAVNKANTVLKDDSASQKDVDEAAKAIRTAIQNLKKPAGTTNKPAQNKPSSSKPANTASVTQTGLFAGLFAATAAGLACLRRRKQK